MARDFDGVRPDGILICFGLPGSYTSDVCLWDFRVWFVMGGRPNQALALGRCDDWATKTWSVIGAAAITSPTSGANNDGLTISLGGFAAAIADTNSRWTGLLAKQWIAYVIVIRVCASNSVLPDASDMFVGWIVIGGDSNQALA
jgi:hypothetical protein